MKLRPFGTTEAQRIKIAEMRERGVGVARIAITVGVSMGAVYYHCLKQGVEPPPRVRRRAPPRGAPRLRRGVTVNPFSAEEDQMLRSNPNLKPTELAKMLTKMFPDRPRRAHSVLARLMILARDAEREAR